MYAFRMLMRWWPNFTPDTTLHRDRTATSSALMKMRKARFAWDGSWRGVSRSMTGCIVHSAAWVKRTGGIAFAITANRFLHHMVRFLVGTMLDVASGRRDIGVISRLLESEDNHEVSPPAPPYGLYLERVEYPRELYLVTA
jgi:hypothetical protein